jgi:hypothetical protein
MLILRIIAGILAFILIGGIFYVTNSFIGNPISKMLADKAIREYVADKYPSLDLEVDKPIYNLKVSAYMARAKSKTSIDTHFPIYYKDGKVTGDDYEIYVLGMFNTRDRLSQEYSLFVRNIIAEELGYRNNTTYVLYKNDEKSKDILKLDMKFDHTLPMDAEVTLRLDFADDSLESIAKVFSEAHQAFLRNNCRFYSYNLYSEKDEGYISVHRVTPQDIESGNLASLLEKAEKDENSGDIFVMRKGSL